MAPESASALLEEECISFWNISVTNKGLYKTATIVFCLMTGTIFYSLHYYNFPVFTQHRLENIHEFKVCICEPKWRCGA